MGKTSETNWTVEDSIDLYNLKRWGSGFFDVDQRGHLVANPSNTNQSVSVFDAIQTASELGHNAPFIVRYLDIIEQRIAQINNAFNAAITEFEYAGSYRCFYPAKVNQHADVIAATIRAGKKFGGGVEAGSKAELLALLLMTDNTVPILCNGFKDRTIVEMAMRGSQLGRDVTIILEKPTELDLVIAVGRELGIRPKLGVRIKLAARSGGRWNASGGAKSKFGLTVSELLDVVSKLKHELMIDCLYLLHYHPGSQISNARKIKTSIVEAARIYADLVTNGAPLTTIDVGGGLAIDYTGEKNRDPSSKNYSLEEYANDVVFNIQQVCKETKVAQPNIISESGRAITAHHSMLVVPILASQQSDHGIETIDDAICQSNPVLSELKLSYDSLHPHNLSECFHDAEAAIETVWQMFAHGSLTLDQRACAEKLVGIIYRKIASMLGELDFVPSELADLRHQLAETYIANFSLFQAIPDAWALNQIFPVAPIHRLDQRPTKNAVIGDITCDSDGKIDCFIGSKGGRNSLRLHALDGNPYYVGIFLIGAYQEALSDDHNLMGNFHVISVSSNGDIDVRPGASAIDVLAHVHHEKEQLCESLEQSITSAVQESRIPDNEQQSFRKFFESVMQTYTYLAPERTSKPINKPHAAKNFANVE